MTIKAIETVYNGYRFRSRLEARWAVFFDALGIEYQYEPEGFDMGEWGWYLPDFFIPAWRKFIEVKPRYGFTADDMRKVVGLCVTTADTVLLFAGDPWPPRHVIVPFIPTYNDDKEYLHQVSYPTGEGPIFLGQGMESGDLYLIDTDEQVGDQVLFSPPYANPCPVKPLNCYWRVQDGQSIFVVEPGRVKDGMPAPLLETIYGIRSGEPLEAKSTPLSIAYHRASGARFEFGETLG